MHGKIRSETAKYILRLVTFIPPFFPATKTYTIQRAATEVHEIYTIIQYKSHEL